MVAQLRGDLIFMSAFDKKHNHINQIVMERKIKK